MALINHKTSKATRYTTMGVFAAAILFAAAGTWYSGKQEKKAEDKKTLKLVEQLFIDAEREYNATIQKNYEADLEKAQKGAKTRAQHAKIDTAAIRKNAIEAAGDKTQIKEGFVQGKVSHEQWMLWLEQNQR